MQLKLVGEAVVDIDEEPNFDAFWLLQIRKAKKDYARKMWNRLSSNEQLDAIIGWVAWRPYYARRELEYVPHPATWLYNKQWEDELPQEFLARASTHASHVAAAIPSSGERATMPDHVKALLAKLRGKA